MSDIDIDAIEARHQPCSYGATCPDQDRHFEHCFYCEMAWPCDAAVLLAALREAEAREARLLAIEAASRSVVLAAHQMTPEMAALNAALASTEEPKPWPCGCAGEHPSYLCPHPQEHWRDCHPAALASTEEPAPTEPEAERP